jgi:hypothetical protein
MAGRSLRRSSTSFAASRRRSCRHSWPKRLRADGRERADCGACGQRCSAGSAPPASAPPPPSRPAASSTIRNSGVFTRSSSSARQAASLSPPMFFTTSRTFWRGARPKTTRATSTSPFCRAGRVRRCRGGSADEVFVAERALRPGFPIRLHLPPSAADRVLVIAPLNRAASARRTRRVLTPARRRGRSALPPASSSEISTNSTTTLQCVRPNADILH